MSSSHSPCTSSIQSEYPCPGQGDAYDSSLRDMPADRCPVNLVDSFSSKQFGSDSQTYPKVSEYDEILYLLRSMQSDIQNLAKQQSKLEQRFTHVHHSVSLVAQSLRQYHKQARGKVRRRCDRKTWKRIRQGIRHRYGNDSVVIHCTPDILSDA